MFVQIGRRPPPADLVTLLRECHGRIRSFCAIASELGRREDVPATEVVEACDRCSRYFVEALPLHVEDEETSVLPRLQGKDSEVDAALAAMHAQHETHQPLLEAFLVALRARRTDPDAAEARQDLALAARRLQDEFAHHLELEERVIFPAISKLLTADEQRAVLAELRARRSHQLGQ